MNGSITASFFVIGLSSVNAAKTLEFLMRKRPPTTQLLCEVTLWPDARYICTYGHMYICTYVHMPFMLAVSKLDGKEAEGIALFWVLFPLSKLLKTIFSMTF